MIIANEKKSWEFIWKDKNAYQLCIWVALAGCLSLFRYLHLWETLHESTYFPTLSYENYWHVILIEILNIHYQKNIKCIVLKKRDKY